MFYYMLVQEKINDAHREAEKAHLIEIGKRPRKIQNRQRLIGLACRFFRIDPNLQKHFDIIDVSLVGPKGLSELGCAAEKKN